MNLTPQIVECPRDAMQGILSFIPTELKTRYLNALLKVGFEILDFGSFVSPKAVPQLADTAQVLAGLELSESKTKLLSIIVNQRGAEEACKHEDVHYLGYPFSISETFQMRNSRKTIAESVELAREIKRLGDEHGKETLVYISMAFGNPYGDPWSPQIAEEWVEKMVEMGIKNISMADTVGGANDESISGLFGTLIPRFPDTIISAHFHSHPDKRKEKIQAAWDQGCRRFDTALNGYGGCPFAEDELVGNIATESLLEFFAEKGIDPGLNIEALGEAMKIATEVFKDDAH